MRCPKVRKDLICKKNLSGGGAKSGKEQKCFDWGGGRFSEVV